MNRPFIQLRTPLAKVDFVALCTGQPVKTVYAMADGGSAPGECYQWVWNVATNAKGKIRNLRFWVQELQAGDASGPAIKQLSLENVIAEILPASRTKFAAGEVCRILQLRDNTVAKLRNELGGQVCGHVGYYPRAGLAQFFRTRWLGAGKG